MMNGDVPICNSSVATTDSIFYCFFTAYRKFVKTGLFF